MNHTTLIVVLVAIVIAGGAYFALAGKSPLPSTVNEMPSTTSGENPQPGSQVHDLPVEPAAAKARADLAAKLSLDEKRIVILEVKEETWTDGCLGLGGPAESCLQALVEGFRVEMLAEGTSYFYRTDKTGATLRMEASE